MDIPRVLRAASGKNNAKKSADNEEDARVVALCAAAAVAHKSSLWYRLLALCLFMHDFDPHAIFKQMPQEREGADASRDHRWCSWYRQDDTGLRLEHTARDHFRHRVTRPMRIFAIYMLVKGLVVCFGQHTLMRYTYLVPQNRSRPAVSREFAQLITDSLGAPYKALDDISLIFSLTTPFFLTVCVCALPAYHWRRPMNAAHLRLLLEPRHEFKRIDASSRRLVASIGCSLRIYRNQQAERFKQVAARLLSDQHNCSSGCSSSRWLFRRVRREQEDVRDDERQRERRVWLEELREGERQHCQWLEAMLGEFRASPSGLRPRTLTPGYYFTLVPRARFLLLGAHSNYTSCALFILACLLYSAQPQAAATDECRSRVSGAALVADCNSLRALSWPELLVILELFITVTITLFSSTLNITLFALLTWCQLDLIGATRAELTTCLEALAAPSREWKVSEPEELERVLLKSMARLLVSDRELRDNARSISEQTVQPSCYLICALLLALVAVQFKLTQASVLRWFIVAILWLTVNAVAISCANINARLLGLQRQLWSILAASSRAFASQSYFVVPPSPPPRCRVAATRSRQGLMKRLMPSSSSGMSTGRLSFRPPFSRRHPSDSQLFMSSERRDGKCCAFVFDLWLKFVLAASQSVDQHCPRLLRLKLSYQTIIEANFFSIFIYSLTLSRPEK